MRNNITSLRRLKAGKPKNEGLNTNRKNFSPAISTNYKIVLEIYCLNKKKVSEKKELKYQRLGRRKSVNTTVKPSFSISAAVISFFEESLLLLKKLRPGMAMETVTK